MRFVKAVKAYLGNHGLAFTLRRAMEKAYEKAFRPYHKWFMAHQPTTAELDAQRLNPPDAGLISILVPVYNTQPTYLVELIDSFIAQTYPHWEACLYDGCSTREETLTCLKEQAMRDPRIRVEFGQVNEYISGNTNFAMAMARGDYFALCDHDDLLTPDALYWVAKAIAEQGADMIYSDEDKVDAAGGYHFSAHFKPDFAPDNLRSCNYICHLMVMKRSLVEQVGGLDGRFDGSQDHEFALRLSEKAERIVHIPRVLYHWRQLESSMSHQNRQKCLDAACRAVQEHLQRTGCKEAVCQVYRERCRVAYPVDQSKRVSVIVDHYGSEAKYRRWQKQFMAWAGNGSLEIIRTSPGSSRFQRLNEAAAKAQGDCLLFTDTAVMPTGEEGLTEMLGLCLRGDTGVVCGHLTARLGETVHSGWQVNTTRGLLAGTQRKLNGIGEYFFLDQMIHNVSAASCRMLITKAADWQMLNGFDVDFKTAFADADYCLRLLEAGRVNVYTPYAKAVADRQKERIAPSDRLRFEQRWQSYQDPYVNDNLR